MADIVRLLAGGYAENARHALTAWARRYASHPGRATPLLPLVPLLTAAVYADEVLFGMRYHRLYRASSALRIARRAGPFGPAAAASPMAAR